jgi:peptide/nickel transport system substrate-binding protein
MNRSRPGTDQRTPTVRVHPAQVLVAGAAAFALALTACSSSKTGGDNSDRGAGTKGTGVLANCSSAPDDCNKAAVKKGGSVTYALEKSIAGWNINSGDSSSFEDAEVLAGITPGAFTANPDLKPALNTDMMISAEQTNTNPQTLVYKIRPEAVWSDGKPIDASDFEFQLKTSDGSTCPACKPATTSGYDQIKSLTPSDNGKTVTVVMNRPYSDWQSMFGTLYPAHIAAEHGNLTNPDGLAKAFNWFDANQPQVSGGPYLIKAADKLTSVTQVPNPKWYGKVKPSLDQLIFRVITDQTQEVPALQNNEVQAIYPQVNADIAAQVEKMDGVDSYLGRGLNWEHLDFNTTNKFLKDKALRTAIFTAVDRKQIISKTIGQFAPGAEPLNSHMYVPGQEGYTDHVTATGQGSGDVDKAKQILINAGYTGVGSTLKDKSGQAISIRCSFTAGNVLRQQSCVLLQSELKALGVDVKPTPTDDLSGTLSDGDFDMIIFAWTATPFAVSGAQQIFKLAGGGDYGKNDDPAVEQLLNVASTETDPALVRDDMNKADMALTADAYNLPLFQKPTFLAIYANIANVRDNATSVGPTYNVNEWGLRAS